jgi:uncharacterized protein (TIGR00369 family)
MKKSGKDKVYKHDIKNYQGPDHYGKFLGYKLKKRSLKTQKTETYMFLEEKHLSSAGRVHGGVVAGFLDFSTASAVFTSLSKDDFCSTVEIKVNYLYPLFLGDLLSAKNEIVFRGKKLCVAQSWVYRNREKKPSALATATFNIVSPRTFQYKVK